MCGPQRARFNHELGIALIPSTSECVCLARSDISSSRGCHYQKIIILGLFLSGLFYCSYVLRILIPAYLVFQIRRFQFSPIRTIQFSTGEAKSFSHHGRTQAFELKVRFAFAALLQWLRAEEQQCGRTTARPCTLPLSSRTGSFTFSSGCSSVR